MSIEDSYAFVHNTKSNIQGIGIKNGKYHGVIYEYKNVSFGTLEDEPDKEVLLSFEYDIIDPFGFKREDFGKKEFANLLGDILVDVIDKYGTGEQFESDD
jgi:hypothetical protein